MHFILNRFSLQKQDNLSKYYFSGKIVVNQISWRKMLENKTTKEYFSQFSEHFAIYSLRGRRNICPCSDYLEELFRCGYSFCYVSEIPNAYQMLERNARFSSVTVPTHNAYMLKSDISECEILSLPQGYIFMCPPTSSFVVT